MAQYREMPAYERLLKHAELEHYIWNSTTYYEELQTLIESWKAEGIIKPPVLLHEISNQFFTPTADYAKPKETKG